MDRAIFGKMSAKLDSSTLLYIALATTVGGFLAMLVMVVFATY